MISGKRALHFHEPAGESPAGKGKWAQSGPLFLFLQVEPALPVQVGEQKMGRKEDILNRVRAIAEPLAAGEGLELVDAEFGGMGGHTILRLFIDKAPAAVGAPAPAPATGSDAAVSLEDCANFSRVVSTALDVEDPLEGAYDLEVSSPGLDRPLRKREHFEKYAGEKIRLKTYGPIETAGGRKTFIGKLLGIDGESIRVDVDGTVFEVPLAQVSKANIDPVFDF